MNANKLGVTLLLLVASLGLTTLDLAVYGPRLALTGLAIDIALYALYVAGWLVWWLSVGRKR